jgi:hypothetical protein
MITDNYYEKLNKFYKLFEDVIYKNNGLIYDEYVCNRILSDHKKNLYKLRKLSMENFYDINYDIETIDRIIISNKINIAFKNNNDHLSFSLFYNDHSNLIDELNICVEITISKNEPPYKSNNYTCYGLVSNRRYNYYYSNNTGTPYDNLNNNDVKKKIIKEVINKQTQYLRGFYSNYDIFLDINRMIGDGWTITNLPYCYSKDTNYNDECPICFNYLNENDDVDNNDSDKTINIFNYNIHMNCLNNYLLSQKDALIFKCPYRNLIDFNCCKYLIKFKII